MHKLTGKQLIACLFQVRHAMVCFFHFHYLIQFFSFMLNDKNRMNGIQFKQQNTRNLPDCAYNATLEKVRSAFIFIFPLISIMSK